MPNSCGVWKTCWTFTTGLMPLAVVPGTRAVICMDEASKQLVGEVRDPLPIRPGDPERIDSEYVR